MPQPICVRRWHSRPSTSLTTISRSNRARILRATRRHCPPRRQSGRSRTSGYGLLDAAGYECYEVSAFARPGRRCRHNVNYWRFGDYLGVGAGAHGKLTDPATRRVTRSEKTRSPRLYMAQAQSGRIGRGERVVAEPDLVFEFMLNALRLRDGFEFHGFERATGLSAAVLETPLERAAERGLIATDAAGRVAPTPLGNRFLNDLQAMFLP